MSSSGNSRMRRTQRRPLSCTECARRKLRCSKTIPCSNCVDRGRAESCRREEVQVIAQTSARSQRSSFGAHQFENLGPNASDPHSPIQLWSAEPDPEPAAPAATDSSEATTLFRADTTKEVHRSNADPLREQNLFRGTNEAAITLEFMALGRQGILNSGTPQPPTRSSSSIDINPLENVTDNPHNPQWDLLVSHEQAYQLLDYHQEHLAWMHNAIHCPSFRIEFTTNLRRGQVADQTWLALYYAIICTTLYHADDAFLKNINLQANRDLVEKIHNQSLQLLYDTKFMAVHTLCSIQTICVLLQVAHNLGQSDSMSVLLACAIRIAQSLSLHRMGIDKSENTTLMNTTSRIEALVEREVKKRVWWFLVRQDWLQIPFQNTYSIHITQFNTPLPFNCHEDIDRMVKEGDIAENETDVYTQSSYTNVLNRTVVVWRHQDGLVSVGHPGMSSDGLDKLYKQVLVADEELRAIWRTMPLFLRDETVELGDLPYSVPHLKRIHQLSMAHKMFTIHRHFQLESLKCQWYGHTRMSCVTIAQKSLRDLEGWPSGRYTQISMKMWTVITHIFSCTICLMFALMLNQDGDLMYDVSEMRRLVLVGRNAMSSMQIWSTIAVRGVKLIDILLDLDTVMLQGQHLDVGVVDIIAHLKNDNYPIASSDPAEPNCDTLGGTNTYDPMLSFMFDFDNI